MGDYLVPLIILAVLFVGFGLTHHKSRKTGGCAGCTDSCADKSECSNEDKLPH